MYPVSEIQYKKVKRAGSIKYLVLKVEQPKAPQVTRYSTVIHNMSSGNQQSMEKINEYELPWLPISRKSMLIQLIINRTFNPHL